MTIPRIDPFLNTFTWAGVRVRPTASGYEAAAIAELHVPRLYVITTDDPIIARVLSPYTAPTIEAAVLGMIARLKEHEAVPAGTAIDGAQICLEGIMLVTEELERIQALADNAWQALPRPTEWQRAAADALKDIMSEDELAEDYGRWVR